MITPADETFLKIKYNIEEFEDHDFIYFNYTRELYLFLKDEKNLIVQTYIGTETEYSIGVYKDSVRLRSVIYYHVIEYLLEYDDRIQRRDQASS